FLAVFPYQEEVRVGPIRSIRPYFAEWALEYTPALVHAGGSEEALKLITQNSEYLDFDENLEEKYLFRDYQYEKPHNLFVNLSEIRKIMQEKNWHSLSTPTFSFSSSKEFLSQILEKPGQAGQITLDFSLASYLVNYVYDEKTRQYYRFHQKTPHIDQLNQKQIAPTNIIVQFTSYTVIDEEGRLDLKTTGFGDAWYFSQGKFWKGYWGKSENDHQTSFYNANGKLITFPPGQTWIEIIDSKDRVSRQL
ncbi:MAG TPA: DUF3048 domain-containing protein, partial [Candidatus Peregrinibacteria bacterium]|nr:DUF3048 domain-containing protein [Candidatus Peregrinibacteria bacterium]